MKALALILKEIRSEMDSMTFSQLIRETRDRLGLMQYRCAEFMNMHLNRLKNLETGYFRNMPSAMEIESLSRFYEIPLDILKAKAEKHVEERKRKKKIRVLDGERSMQKVQ